MSAVAEPPNVVEVEPRRREQVGAVVVLVLEDPADEREAVRVNAGRRQSRRRGRRPRPASRRSRDPARRCPRTYPRSRARPPGRCRAARPSRRRSARRLPRGRLLLRPPPARRPAPGRWCSRRRSRAATSGSAPHVITSLMQWAARSAPQFAQRAALPREDELRAHRVGRRSQQPRVVERVKARESAEATWRPWTRRRRAAVRTTSAPFSMETPASSYVRPPTARVYAQAL